MLFCPNMRRGEILELNALHPELAQRAIAIESNADLSSVKGLGRQWSWGAMLATPDMFADHFEKAMPCGCYDGDQ